eukprot:3020877-Rhodomonas_salina.2
MVDDVIFVPRGEAAYPGTRVHQLSALADNRGARFTVYTQARYPGTLYPGSATQAQSIESTGTTTTTSGRQISKPISKVRCPTCLGKY